MADNNTYRIHIAVEDPETAQTITDWLNTDKTIETVVQVDHNPVDLMIVEIAGQETQILEDIEALMASQMVGELFLLSRSPDAGLLMKLMRLGVKEFMPLPVEKEEFTAAIERFKQRHRSNALAGVLGGNPASETKKGRVISVVGSKGGVGATTVAVNLAVSLMQSSKTATAALFDMNTLFGEIPLFLDLTPKFHWGHIMKNIDRLDHMFLMNTLSKHPSGVHLLPSPAYLNGNNFPTIDVVDRLLDLMRTLFDFIVVDTGQSLEDVNLRMLQNSDDVMLVSQLNVSCLSNTNRLVKSLTDLGYVAKNQLKVVINRSQKKNDISIEDAQAGIDKEIFFAIPNDFKTTMAAINQGVPLQLSAPKSSIAKSFEQMSRKLLPHTTEAKRRRWGLFGTRLSNPNTDHNQTGDHRETSIA